MLAENFNCIVVLGPTASGKTRLACFLADRLNGEIISLDSRQVYKGLDIGTGKDLSEYEVRGKQIPYHLIDLNEVHQKFYLHHLTKALKRSFVEILGRKKLPILCGGTGLYLDALRKNFSYTQAPEDPEFRLQAEHLSKEELKNCLKELPDEYTKHVDKNSRKRLIRGIEVARFLLINKPDQVDPTGLYKPYYIGLRPEKAALQEKIHARLVQRLNKGLIEETQSLIQSGISPARLKELGLEYKFVAQHLSGVFDKEELFEKLFTAIKQFAKRQMTWFRKMERDGLAIHWFDPETDPEQILGSIVDKKARTLH